MKKYLLPVVISVAAVALFAGLFLIVHVPGDSVAVVDTGRSGEPLKTLAPGFYLRAIGSTMTMYSTRPVTATGEVIATPATGGEIPLSFTATCALDPARVTLLHKAISGRPLDVFHSSQVGVLLRSYASQENAYDLLTPEFRARAAETMVDLMKKGGLADATIEIKPPDESTLLAAAQTLAPRGTAGMLRPAVSELLQKVGTSAGWKLLTAMGIVNEADREFAAAERNYLDALAIDPAALPPMSQLFALNSALQEWKKLARVLDAALTAAPNSLQHINWFAMALIKIDNYQGAEEILKKGLAIDPNNTTLLANLGGLCLKTGRTEEARQYFTKAVEAAPSNPQALFNLGSLLASEGKYGEALPYLERAEEAGSRTIPLIRTLGIVYERLGESAKAAAYGQRLKEMEALQKERRDAARSSAPPQGAALPSRPAGRHAA